MAHHLEPIMPLARLGVRESKHAMEDAMQHTTLAI
jgi:hypothetical protein